MDLLTPNAIQQINNGEELVNPVLQIISIKKIVSESSKQERYRVALSDGKKYQAGMLATQLNHLIGSEGFQKNVIVSLQRYVLSKINERQVIIALELNLKEVHPSIIGQPTVIESKQPSQPQGQPQPQQPQQPQPQQQQQPQQPQPQPQQQNNNNNNNNMNNNKENSKPNMMNNTPKGKSMRNDSRNNMSPMGQLVVSICSLNPYQNRWTIKARVTNKQAMRHYTNAKGEGKLISFDLTDESGEIKCTAFNETAEKLDNTIELNKVYYFSSGMIKTANKKWSHLKNDYEITFNKNVQISECTEAAGSVPSMKFSFIPIFEIENKAPESVIDVIGVVKKVDECSTINTKKGTVISKRNLTIMDDSQTDINITLWGTQAETFSPSTDDKAIVAVKGARVGDFGGRQLSLQMSSVMVINPDIQQAHRLRGWYDSVGHQVQANSLSGQGLGGNSGWTDSRLMLRDVKERSAEDFEKPLYFVTRGYINIIKKDRVVYLACSNEGCNKKVTEHNGMYNCEKCQTPNESCSYRYMLQMQIADSTGKVWCGAFHDTASLLLEQTAEVMYNLQQDNPQEFEKILGTCKFKPCTFKLRASADNYNDMFRVRFGMNGYKPTDYVSEGHNLLSEIKNLQQSR